MNILETIVSHDTVVPMKKLTDVTVEEDVAALTIDTSGNAWGAYDFILLRFTAKDPVSGMFTLRVNGSTSDSFHMEFYDYDYATHAAGLMEDAWSHGILALFMVNRGMGKVHGVYLSSRFQNCYYTRSTQYMNSLVLAPQTGGGLDIKAGSRFEVWGIRL